MKDFWKHFFYGFMITTLILLCALMVVYGVWLSKEYSKTVLAEKPRVTVSFPLVFLNTVYL